MKRNTEESGDDDFDQEADLERRHARGRAVRLFSNFPLLGFIVRVVSNFFGGQLQEALRRRRSFKLALFYQTQMVVGLVGFLLYFVLAISDLAYIKNTSLVSAECSLPDTVTLANGTSLLVYDASATAVNMDTLHAYAVTNRDVLDCTNDNVTVLDAACTLAEFTTLLYLMLSCAILFLVSALVCQIVASGFKFFSNLPMESLDVDLVSCKVSFLGTACKYGPWAARLLTVITLAFVIALTILPTASNLCLGSMKSTHQCLNMFDSCGYYKILNCRYYFSDNCVGTDLPHASSQASSFSRCLDPAFAASFSGRMDMRLVYPTPCSRCWALHSDCKDAAINRARLTKDKTSSEFVYYTGKEYSESPAISSLEPNLGNYIYCKCMQGLDATGSPTENQRILYFDPARLLNNATSVSCASFNTSSACDPFNPVPAPVDSYTPGADWWSEKWDDAIAGTTAVQECSWGPKNSPEFFYEASECDQAGSRLNRYVFILSYVSVTLIALLILAGLSVRYTVQAETWSYSPQLKDEPWHWSLLRQFGPG